MERYRACFELSKIPYVGCGVLSSAVSMDKVYTKIIVDRLGIDQAKFVHVRESDFKDDDLTDAMDRVGSSFVLSGICKAVLCGIFQGSFQSPRSKRTERGRSMKRSNMTEISW